MSRKIGRRDFIGTLSCGAIASTSIMNALMNLKSINALCAANSALDPEYKALVCIMKSGGNDSFNMLVPNSPNEHSEYLKMRTNLGIPRAELNALQTLNTPGRQFGLHPDLSQLAKLYNQGKVAFVSNIGTLVEPTTKNQFLNEEVKPPLGLFSHSDQIIQWQTSIPTERSHLGWGGRLADLVRDMNTEQDISMNISLSGTNVFEVGKDVIEYVIDKSNGSVGITGYGPPMRYYDFDNARSQAIDSMLKQNYTDFFQKTYIDVVKTARDGHLKFDRALNSAPDLTTQFGDSDLAQTLNMIARTISIHQKLGFKRQIFFVDFYGWDHHDEVLNNQAEMFSIMDEALFSFQSAMEELNLSKQVTTFTMSEFGRTLTSNGNGTDHAWGGNVFAMGGAVNGSRVFGNYPILNPNGNQIIYDNIVLPSTPTESYFGELALWMGVSPSDLSYVLPNIGNFYNVNSPNKPLGFLKF